MRRFIRLFAWVIVINLMASPGFSQTGENLQDATIQMINSIRKVANKNGTPVENFELVRSSCSKWIKELKRQDEKSVPKITSAIAANPGDWMTNIMLTEALGEIPHKSAVEALSTTLSDGHQNEKVRVAAARNLAKSTIPESEPFIERAVEDKALPLRARQVIMMELPVRGMEDVDWLKKIAMADKTVFGQDEKITQEEFGMILNAQRTLSSSHNPRSTDVLLELIASHPTNSILIRALAAKKDKRAIPVLIKCLENESPRTQSQGDAALALASLKAQEAVPALINILETTKRPSLVSVAATALGDIGDKQAVQPLENVVKDLASDPRFTETDRQQSAEGWGYIPPIIKALGKLKK